MPLPSSIKTEEMDLKELEFSSSRVSLGERREKAGALLPDRLGTCLSGRNLPSRKRFFPSSVDINHLAGSGISGTTS